MIRDGDEGSEENRAEAPPNGNPYLDSLDAVFIIFFFFKLPQRWRIARADFMVPRIESRAGGSSQLVLIKCRSSGRVHCDLKRFPEGNYTVNYISSARPFPPALFIRSLVSHLGLAVFLPR